MPFALKPESLQSIKATLASRSACKLVSVLQVKAKSTYQVEVTAELPDGSRSRWRSDGMKYPHGNKTRRDWDAEAQFAAAWRPDHTNKLVPRFSDARRKVEAKAEAPPPPREKRSRDCHYQENEETPPAKRGGIGEGAGRPKGGYGRKKLPELLHTEVPNSAPPDDSQLLDSQQEQQQDEGHDGEEEAGDGEQEEEVIQSKGEKGKGKKGDKKKQETTKKTAAASKKDDVKKKAAKKEEVEVVTVRDVIARVPLPSGESGKSCSFTVLSWNVNGLRATVKNGLEVLRRMVETERPDLVCFQETKLQEKDVQGMREQDILPGYASEWSCSTVKKGYAGTAVFFTKQAQTWTKGEGTNEKAASGPAKKKQKQGKLSAFFSAKEATTANTEKANDPPADDAAEGAAALPGGRSGLKVLAVRYGIGNSKHDGEGRSITVEYEKFFVVTLYVPNSGQKLERLGYRTKEWDVALRAYVKSLEAEGKPVVVNGDLNVAHLDLDIYNNGAKHLLKSAGTTKEERGSFDAWMEEGVVADAFRRLHPDARGAYTYWSMRTNARPVNKGLRLDYFLCTASMLGGGGGASAGGKNTGGQKMKMAKASTPEVVVHDCFQLEAATVGLSDHCPIGLVLCTTK